MPKRVFTPDFYARNRWEFVFVALALCFVVALGGTKVNSDRISNDAEKGAVTYKALCALSADYRDRYHTDKRFLAHPAIKLPRAALQAYRLRVASERRTLRALQVLRC